MRRAVRQADQPDACASPASGTAAGRTAVDPFRDPSRGKAPGVSRGHQVARIDVQSRLNRQMPWNPAVRLRRSADFFHDPRDGPHQHLLNCACIPDRSAMSQVLFDYAKQDASGAVCSAHAWAKVPAPLGADDAARVGARRGAAEGARRGAGRALLRRPRPAGPRARKPAAASPIRWKWRASAATIRRRRWWSRACASWARRAKILSPEKRVLMPDLDATCSLDLGCPADEFARLLRRSIPTARSSSTPTPAPR